MCEVFMIEWRNLVSALLLYIIIHFSWNVFYLSSLQLPTLRICFQKTCYFDNLWIKQKLCWFPSYTCTPIYCIAVNLASIIFGELVTKRNWWVFNLAFTLSDIFHVLNIIHTAQCKSSKCHKLILAHFNTGVLSQICQIAKFKPSPKFPAVWYTAYSQIMCTSVQSLHLLHHMWSLAHTHDRHVASTTLSTDSTSGSVHYSSESCCW